MIGDVIRANAVRNPHRVMTEEEQALLRLRDEPADVDPWENDWDDGVSFEPPAGAPQTIDS